MIEIKDLCKSYNDKVVYKHFNLQLQEGIISCIIGPSGCGKTTLLKILAGLEDYEAGKITGLDGRKVSFAFQEDRLMPWLSVGENITYVLEDKTAAEKEEKLAWVLKLMRLEKEAVSSIDQLSGGMKRRVAIARALVYDGSLLLMDEPFKGLDDALKWDMLEKLRLFWQEKQQTVVIVTHDQEAAEKLGNIIDLEKV